jgi:acetylornithine deacetylase/succinyl-diaminopimelate desuccinylase-like protein
MTPLHDRIAVEVDRAFDDSVAFLRELVRVPTDTPPGDNAPHAARTAELLEAMGETVERHPVPEAEVRAAGLVSIANLVVRRRFGEGGPTIALAAHGDVVPPGDGWTHPPYGAAIEEGRMFGRGVAVSKSDFATYLFAVRALERAAAASDTLCGGCELHFTYDEEVGGTLGPARLLRERIVRPDLAICAGFSHAIVTAHNGSLQLAVTVHGRAAHAAMPESGADALQASLVILERLYAMRTNYARRRSSVPGIGTPTLNVGRIDGGSAANVVPARVVFHVDRRIVPEEDPDEVERSLVATIGDAAQSLADVRVETRRLLLARPLAPLPGHERLAAALGRHAERVFGEPVGIVGTPLYTDARHYAEAGVPAVVYGAGPRTILEANAKRPDENLALSDLRGATLVVACALADLLRR